MTELSGLPRTIGVADASGFARGASQNLRTLAIAGGLAASLLFVVIGVRYELQMYADGSLFSYAVAVQDAWAFHCHNIAGRLSVYLFAFAPAEAYIRLTGDAQGGVALYGLLFFILPFLGLIATFAADRSQGRLCFNYACVSTVCLCPLVFGFPTEVWMMHALFWPALACSHFARRGAVGAAAIFVFMLALVFTHAGALISAAAILATLSLRGSRDFAFRRGCVIFAVVILFWVTIKLMLRPDAYTSMVLARAALHVFDLSIFTGPLFQLFFCALAGYALMFFLCRRLNPLLAHVYAAASVAGALALYWLRVDSALHADNRYYLRTVLLVATPTLGLFAAAHLLAGEGDLHVFSSVINRTVAAINTETGTRAIMGALVLVMLVHVVETEKFLRAWTGYKAAVRSLAMGDASDPALGNPALVSSDHIRANLSRPSWFSTTPFLSVLLAPKFTPRRLVVHPRSNYFWLSCETATENRDAPRAMPVQTRDLIRAYSCLHRWRRTDSLAGK
jgi:hypothetical protein